MLTARYLDSTEDLIGGRLDGTCDPAGRVRKVDSYLEFGVRGTYNFTERFQLAGGIQNLTSEEPPFSEWSSGGWPWFNQEMYDPRGTRYYLNISYSFF